MVVEFCYLFAVIDLRLADLTLLLKKRKGIHRVVHFWEMAYVPARST